MIDNNYIIFSTLFALLFMNLLLYIMIKKERNVRYVQDLKLYNYIKSNYNVLIGKRLPVEDKIEKDGEKNQYF